MCVCLYQKSMCKYRTEGLYQGELNTRRGQQGFRTLCCDVFGLLENQFLCNNNDKGSRSNVNKHQLVYGESSSYARDAPMSVYHLCYCLQSLFLLLRKNQFSSSLNMSQQSVRKPYCPLLVFNSSWCVLQVYTVHKNLGICTVQESSFVYC